MASNSETGNAKNIANFELLDNTCKGFGVTYNPSNTTITTASMDTLLISAKAGQAAAITQRGLFDPVENNRRTVFAGMKNMIRQVGRAAKTCGAGPLFYKDVMSLIKKIFGERTSKVKATPTDPAGTSVSQQSYDNVANTLAELIAVLTAEPLYAPNEAELTVAALTARLTSMQTANTNVGLAAIALRNAIAARNNVLYNDETGVITVGQTAKDYVRSVYGYSSAEYKMVSKIQFKDNRN